MYFPTGRSITADCYPKMISLQTLQVVSGCGCRQLSALNDIYHFFATGHKTFRPDPYPHTHIMTRFIENNLFVKNRLRLFSSLVGVLMILFKPRTTSRGGGGWAGMFFSILVLRLGVVVPVDQSISERLKALTKQTRAFL